MRGRDILILFFCAAVWLASLWLVLSPSLVGYPT